MISAPEGLIKVITACRTDQRGRLFIACCWNRVLWHDLWWIPLTWKRRRLAQSISVRRLPLEFRLLNLRSLASTTYSCRSTCRQILTDRNHENIYAVNRRLSIFLVDRYVMHTYIFSPCLTSRWHSLCCEPEPPLCCHRRNLFVYAWQSQGHLREIVCWPHPVVVGITTNLVVRGEVFSCNPPFCRLGAILVLSYCTSFAFLSLVDIVRISKVSFVLYLFSFCFMESTIVCKRLLSMSLSFEIPVRMLIVFLS